MHSGHTPDRLSHLSSAAVAAGCCVLLPCPAQQVPSSDSTPAEDQTDDLLLRETVLREAVMYGEMVQAVYDTLQTKDKFREYYGYCAPGVMLPGDQLAAVGEYTTLGEGAKSYRVSHGVLTAAEQHKN